MELFAETEYVSRSQMIKKVFKEYSSELDHYESEGIVTYSIRYYCIL